MSRVIIQALRMQPTVLGLQALIALVTATYLAYEGKWKSAGAALLPTIESAYKGKEVLAAASAHETFPEGGAPVLHGKRKVVDELRVVFRAESEDDLTKSFGMVAQEETIAHPQVQ